MNCVELNNVQNVYVQLVMDIYGNWKAGWVKALLFATAIGLAGIQSLSGQTTSASFSGSYFQNFDLALTNDATLAPAGYRLLILPGGNTTYTAANPITSAAIASAIAPSTQNLTVWNFGSPVIDSATALFNVGSIGNLGDRALGSDPTSIGAAIIELSLSNATGVTLSGVNFSYDLKVLTNGNVGTEAGELPGYAFFYSMSGGATAAEWAAVPALSLANYTQGTTMSSGVVTIMFPSPLATNGTMYFRWTDDNNMANSPDQMLAIDNIAISAFNLATPTNFPSAPTVVSPLAGSTLLSNSVVLNVSVSAPYTSNLTVNFYGRTAGTGNFLNLGTVPGVASGGNALANWSGLAASANYEWFASASDGVSTVSNAVTTFSVAAVLESPVFTVTLTNPTNGMTLSSPTNLMLAVNLIDLGGTVTNVTYYQGATKIGNVSTNPFNFNWAGAASGRYSLTAVASDNGGAMATSGAISLTLTNSIAVQTLQKIKTVFVIAMENHNFTQPNPTSSPQAILGNPAAPYLNSLITPGNSNSVQVSYATKYYGTAFGLHPSEPNYIWAEAGTDFGIETDSEPSLAAGNLFDAPHLTRQLNAAGIPWMNYEEDIQISGSPINTLGGFSTTTINPYYGTGDYAYAARHNPMAFFVDTQFQNVYPLANLFTDLANNKVGRYNWITPNLFNDQHTAINGGFIYQGVGYADNQAAIAQGDNFLATVIPQIMASAAYTNQGVIILRWDETEGGDDTNFTLPEIIISPLAKGNAYASGIEYNHSSDVKTMDEIFGLNLLVNPIPSREVGASGQSVNYVATANDLSDMFQVITVTNPITTFTIPTNTISVSTNFTGRMLPSTGVFELRFTGPSGQGYRVLAADSLATPLSKWVQVGTGTFVNSNAIFPDLDATNHQSRFYLISSP